MHRDVKRKPKRKTEKPISKMDAWKRILQTLVKDKKHIAGQLKQIQKEYPHLALSFNLFVGYVTFLSRRLEILQKNLNRQGIERDIWPEPPKPDNIRDFLCEIAPLMCECLKNPRKCIEFGYAFPIDVAKEIVDIFILPVSEPDWFTDRQQQSHLASVNTEINLPLTLERKITLPGPVYSSAASGHGNVYIGSDDNNLYALSPQDGTIRWSFDTGGNVRSSATAVEEEGFQRVFITSENGKLFSIDPNTRNEKWRLDGGGPFISSTNYARLTNGTGSIRLIFYIHQDGLSSILRAVNAETGTVEWEETIGNISCATPMFAAESVFVGIVQGGRVFKQFNPLSGEIIWEYSDAGIYPTHPPGSFTSGIAHLDPKPGYPTLVVFSSRCKQVQGVDLNSKNDAWKTSLDGVGEISGLALTQNRDSNILVVSQAGDLYALDPDTGVILWHHPFSIELSNDMINRITPRPTIWGDFVIHSIGARPGGDIQNSELKAISLLDGLEKGSYGLDDFAWSSPAICKGKLYIGTISGSVYAFSHG